MKAKSAFWLESDNQKACEIAHLAGYQIVIFDMEHGTLDEPLLDRLIPFCNGIGLETYVRVGESTQPRIQMALDIGATGVILPQIRDLAHAESAASFAKYPPRGGRGLGYSRTQQYGAASDAFVAAENNLRRCYVMIETVEAFAQAAQIAKLDCVDGLFIGPADLSLARGRGVFATRPEDIADMTEIATVAKAAGKPWAVAAGNAVYRKAALALGPSFATSADDLSALLSGFRQLQAQHDPA